MIKSYGNPLICKLTKNHKLKNNVFGGRSVECLGNAAPESQGLLNKNPGASCKMLLVSYCLGRSQRPPNNTGSYHSSRLPPELGDKPLLLNTHLGFMI